MTADIKNDIANEALRVVNGARRSAYGRPEQNFERIARLQAAYMASRAEPNGEVRPIDVPFLNLMQKVARICESPMHRDSFVDALGYVMCAAEVAGVPVAKPENPKPLWRNGEYGADEIRKACMDSAPGETERLLGGKTFPPEAEGWIEWSGGERPVRGYTWVDYKLRNRDRGRSKAGLLDWRHAGLDDADIVAYRVVKP